MKRIAIFSDIHGNLEVLNSILKDIERNNIDEVICLGDIVGLGPNSKECLDIIMNSKIKMVKGNHEMYIVNDRVYDLIIFETEKEYVRWLKQQLSEEEIEYIENLPISFDMLINGNLFTFCHFLFNIDTDYFYPLTILDGNSLYEISKKLSTNYMFFGHSHSPFQISNHGLFTCVGSSSCFGKNDVRKKNVTYYTIVEIEDKNVKIIKKELEYDRELFEEKIKNSDYPNIERAKERFGF